MNLMTTPTQPKIFISYSWTSEEHAERVRDLADRLLASGIDVLLDQYDLKEGQDKYHFMERSVSDKTVTKVVMICDQRYAERADERAGGVGHESTIISPQVYNQSTDKESKFVPVIFQNDDQGNPYVPAYLASRIFIDMSTETLLNQNFEQLVRFIYEKPIRKKPTVGQTPQFILEDTRAPLATTGKFDQIKTNIERGRDTFTLGIFSDYLDVLLQVLSDMPIAQDGQRLDDDLICREIQAFTPYKVEFAQVLHHFSRYVPQLEIATPLIDFFERALPLIFRVHTNNYIFDGENDHVRFSLRELFVYGMVILTKTGNLTPVVELLSHSYHFKEHSRGRTVNEPFGIFDRYLDALDTQRKRRLNLNRISLHADMIVETAESPLVLIGEYIEMDALLWARAELHDDHWYPRTLVYYNRFEGALTQRAASNRRFAPVAAVLGVSSPAEFQKRWAQLPDDAKTLRRSSTGMMITQPATLLQFEQLGTKP
ncbi:SEFIR domain-containing protein (plasmid) [Deinococcus peraridilitoris DSM 19664]|uniref:SEFIR domain-containing protein n=2 Tax=Deinococcus TaxID=1298 RepID=L0A8B4_DEIPD|nr:SEFIR domain-containing protein [Deinococcus peraridilitoris DSM 19664]